MIDEDLKINERLVVSLDFKWESDLDDIKSKILNFCDEISDTGVYVKLNSSLRLFGYPFINEIKKRNLKFFADLKLFDIKETVLNDLIFLREFKPDILTVSSFIGSQTMSVLKKELKDTEILAVTILTSFSDTDCRELFSCSIDEMVFNLVNVANNSNVDGIVCSVKELSMLKDKYSNLTFNTPAIRPNGSKLLNDDQNIDRISTPTEAIRSGSDRIIVGRPITQSQNPKDVINKILKEIENEFKELKKDLV